MDTLYQICSGWLGLGVEPKDLTFLEVCIRGIIALAFALFLVRIGSKRALAEKTPFDAILVVVLASVLARAINGSAPFFPTLGCGLVLVLLHRIVAFLAYRSHAFGMIIKGDAHTLVENGKMNLAAMRRYQVSAHDLEEDMRLTAKTDDLSKIKVARVERSGDISFIKKEGS